MAIRGFGEEQIRSDGHLKVILLAAVLGEGGERGSERVFRGRRVLRRLYNPVSDDGGLVHVITCGDGKKWLRF